MKKRALLSVSDKTNIVQFAKGLTAFGFEIVSTGGTFTALKKAGVDVISVDSITNFPEILDGRVKTLHPAIHGGLLAVKENPSHIEQINNHNIKSIDLVAVNLYPFKNVIQRPDTTYKQAIENIDIGGPSMLRSAAKNHADVTVIVDPSDYETVLEHLKNGDISRELKRQLAAKVFRHTAAYDAIIAEYLTEDMLSAESITLTYEKHQNLRYGENPHQQAAFYRRPIKSYGTIAYAKQLHGKELSYNNINDADAALLLIKEFDEPAAVAVKHMNPCGAAIGSTLYEAYKAAYQADPISIFGGIIALSQEVCAQTAQELHKTFLEIILAPSFSPEALEILTQKQNLRLLQVDTRKNNLRYHAASVSGGMLIQEEDTPPQPILTFPTIAKPTQSDLEQAVFAWKIVKYVKSNAIVLVKNNATIGIGPGQTSRIGAAKIAIENAGDKAIGSVLASDAFFPMPDTIEAAAAAGIKTIIQPGGSIKDEEIIAACDKHSIAMIFTGTRHFRH